jgi:hypothetical protein
MENSFPKDIFVSFFSPEMLKLTQKETNRYSTQQVNKTKNKSAFCHPTFCLRSGIQSIEWNKTIVWDHHLHTQVISDG